MQIFFKNKMHALDVAKAKHFFFVFYSDKEKLQNLICLLTLLLIQTCKTFFFSVTIHFHCMGEKDAMKVSGDWDCQTLT